MFKIGWFSTGRDQAAQDLLVRVVYEIQRGEIPQTEISYVFCNREWGESKESDKFLDLVLRLGIPLKTESSAKFAPELRKENPYVWRICYHAQLRRLLGGFKEDIRFLAGYMLILDYETCLKKPTLNLHPALPAGPKGAWQEVIWQLIREKAEFSGVMIHLVTPDLDAGFPITFCKYPLKGTAKLQKLWRKHEEKLAQGLALEDIIAKEEERYPLFAEIRKEGLKREFPLINETLKLLAQRAVVVKSGEAFDRDGKQLAGGFDLSFSIEKIIKFGRQHNLTNLFDSR